MEAAMLHAFCDGRHGFVVLIDALPLDSSLAILIHRLLSRSIYSDNVHKLWPVSSGPCICLTEDETS